MVNVKFVGNKNKVRLELSKLDGLPIIKKNVYEVEEVEIENVKLDVIPAKGEIFALSPTIDIEVVEVKRFLNGDVIVYTNAILGEIVDPEEEEIINNYKALETKKFIEKMKKENKSFIEFLNLIGGEGLSDEQLLNKYKSMNEMLKVRDDFFR